MDWSDLFIAGLAFALGGVLKGATGAGAPIVAVPILSMLYDVPLAVCLFAVPNLLSNIWQGWRNRAHLFERRFVVLFAGAGFVGAAIGTIILARLPSTALLLAVAFAVVLFLLFRLARPDWVMNMKTARKWAVPAGLSGGILQGAVGISAPVSLTFLSALRLPRLQFMATISIFFAAMAAIQLPMLAAYGLMTWERAGMSLVATLPLFGAMPIGGYLARYISRQAFDRIILVLLAVVAVRLVWSALGGTA